MCTLSTGNLSPLISPLAAHVSLIPVNEPLHEGHGGSGALAKLSDHRQNWAGEMAGG